MSQPVHGDVAAPRGWADALMLSWVEVDARCRGDRWSVPTLGVELTSRVPWPPCRKSALATSLRHGCADRDAMRDAAAALGCMGILHADQSAERMGHR